MSPTNRVVLRIAATFVSRDAPTRQAAIRAALTMLLPAVGMYLGRKVCHLRQNRLEKAPLGLGCRQDSSHGLIYTHGPHATSQAGRGPINSSVMRVPLIRWAF